MKRVLTINIPFTVPWALPYGSAVVNGILQDGGYETTAWDLSIDLTRKFRNHKEFEIFSHLLSIGGYYQGAVSKYFLRKVLIYVKQTMKKKLGECNPNIVLLSVFSSQSLDFVIPVVTILRNIAPDLYILVGGRGLDNVERQTNMIYGDYFVKYLPINATYLGDAENDLLKVIQERFQGCYRAGLVMAEQLVNVPPANWNGLNFEDYDGYQSGDLRIPITASKGCVRQCTFCDVAGSWPKYVFRSGSDVGHEIVSLYHKTGMRKIEFTDNLINGSISNFRAMNQVLADNIPNTIDYLGYAICRSKNNFPESDFELASVAGAKILKVGIESGSENVRNDMKKKFTNDDIDWFATNCYKYNIKQVWLMFTGYPSETEEDFQQTLKLLKEYSPIAKKNMIEIFLSLPMMLTTNSSFMRHYAIDYGLEHNKDNKWADFFWTSTKFTENTFDVRIDRWRRFMAAIELYGYKNKSMRQTEKLLELNGLEKIYKDYKHASNQKKFIPISNDSININQDTHL